MMIERFKALFDQTMAELEGVQIVAAAVVGSGVYLEAAHDLDVLLLVNEEPVVWLGNSISDDWYCSSEYDTPIGNWISLRKSTANLIVTNDREFFDNFRLAAGVCEALKLEAKRDRMIVHRVIRDKVAPNLAAARVDEELAVSQPETEIQ